MTDDERREELAEARMFALAAPVILPLLERRRKIAFETLMTDFKSGRTDHTARIAELNVLSDLERDIRRQESNYRSLEEQAHANRRK